MTAIAPSLSHFFDVFCSARQVRNCSFVMRLDSGIVEGVLLVSSMPWAVGVMDRQPNCCFDAQCNCTVSGVEAWSGWCYFRDRHSVFMVVFFLFMIGMVVVVILHLVVGMKMAMIMSLSMVVFMLVSMPVTVVVFMLMRVFVDETVMFMGMLVPVMVPVFMLVFVWVFPVHILLHNFLWLFARSTGRFGTPWINPLYASLP
ncbi:hypothetical protein HNQ81_003231 [Desulfoprunum benzoelyticum]|uniref:Uncharacterized protein n=1 Tax=Desulfoprunum benzoelyticum TaxID=1506996 RepID=A0A840UTG5_9BACT|nr:hypothetical protein [Desulfoprunum benzoelyticum]MBB5349477.1 hypothetical protein [Desulfoprunum benzoelyticum]